MPKGKDSITATDAETTDRSARRLNRRRLLKLSGVGLIGGAALTSTTVGAQNIEHAHTLIFENQESTPSSYEFLVSDGVEPAEEIGVDEDALINGKHVIGTVDDQPVGYRFSGTLNYLDVDGSITVSIRYEDEDEPTGDRIEIVASSDGDVDYTFDASDRVEKVLDNGEYSADHDDEIHENSDGSHTVIGSTANGAGDTYDFQGEIEYFDPVEGEFTLFINGEETTVTDLTGQEPPEDDAEDEETDTRQRQHWYSFTATGSEPLDYYLEVEEGGDMIASTVDDAVVDEEYHWINDDATKAAGRVQPGETHAYEFDTLVADSTLDGEGQALVNGSESNLSLYPREIASGDHWKGHFPWHIDGEERTHTYSFDATGEEYIDYYLEVEDEGRMIPSTVRDASIEYEYFWISDDGTRAAGRVQPGDTHAYTFDTLVLDATIDGDGIAYVNGGESSIGRYPLDGASGDHWKGGFPWQDDDDGYSSGGGTDAEGGDVIGGGSGYDRLISQSEADYTVASASELQSALSAAGSGDIVYITDGFDAGSGSFTVPSGVTVAGYRGVDGADGPLVHTDSEPNSIFDMRNGSRLTGIRLRGPYHGVRGISHSQLANQVASGVYLGVDNAEVDNNEISGFGLAAIWQAGGSGNNHIHHNYLYDNNTNGLGYGVVVYGTSSNPLIEYNYFNDNRHSVACSGANYGYVCRYNHFGPRSFHHVIDIHDPGATETYVQNNIVESIRRDLDNQRTVAVGGHSEPPNDILLIEDNWFYQAESYAFSVASSNVVIRDNHHTPDAPVEYDDIIPGHPGTGHTPW